VFACKVYSTFKAACAARGLLQGDDEWTRCLNEAAVVLGGRALRRLFVTILVSCEVCDPPDLWVKHRANLADDLLQATRHRLGDVALQLNDTILNDTLFKLSNLLRDHHMTLLDFGLPNPDPSLDISDLSQQQPRMVAEALQYDRASLRVTVLDREGTLNEEQKVLYFLLRDQIINPHVSGTYRRFQLVFGEPYIFIS